MGITSFFRQRARVIQPRPFQGLSRDELLDLARRSSWVHSIDVGDFVTPGIWGGHNPEIHRAMAEIDFKGKKVLDIGAWDGLWSFMAEQAGAAEVWATDLNSQRVFTENNTFQIAAALRNSRVQYAPDLSVYDVEKLGVTDFDVVIYCGIYYHLKDPLRAMSVLRRSAWC